MGRGSNNNQANASSLLFGSGTRHGTKKAPQPKRQVSNIEFPMECLYTLNKACLRESPNHENEHSWSILAKVFERADQRNALKIDSSFETVYLTAAQTAALKIAIPKWRARMAGREAEEMDAALLAIKSN